MADKMYCIWGSTLTGIGDAIRAKTGTSDKIDPNDMPAAIESIEGSGGAEGCATVTFMDGDAVLLSRPVYIGDDCPDPVAQGRIDAPTKDSTIDTVYTFNGWSGSLEGITEDTTVEAVYKESVREYTVRFYDGETLLHTEQVPYGVVPNPDAPVHPTDPDHNVFDSWVPSLVAVTGDADYTVVWREKLALRDYTWADLDAMPIEEMRSNFSVGDEGPGATVLLGFEHDDLADGTGKARMTFGSFVKLDKSLDYAVWSGSGNLDWSGCNYRKNAETWAAGNTTLAGAIPYAKLVKKKYIALDGTIKECEDKYFAPSLSELGYIGSSVPNEGEKYPVFNSVELSAPVSCIKATSYPYYTGTKALYTRTIFPATAGVYTAGGSAAPLVVEQSKKLAPHATFCI